MKKIKFSKKNFFKIFFCSKITRNGSFSIIFDFFFQSITQIGDFLISKIPYLRDWLKKNQKTTISSNFGTKKNFFFLKIWFFFHFLQLFRKGKAWISKCVMFSLKNQKLSFWVLSVQAKKNFEKKKLKFFLKIKFFFPFPSTFSQR